MMPEKLYLTKEEISSIALDLKLLLDQDVIPLSRASRDLISFDEKITQLEEEIKND